MVNRIKCLFQVNKQNGICESIVNVKIPIILFVVSIRAIRVECMGLKPETDILKVAYSQLNMYVPD